MKKYFILLLLFTSYTAIAQENSPYTRYGLGEFRDNAPVSLRGWGSQDACFQNPNAFNPINPASLGSLTNPCFQVAFYGKGMQIKSSTEQKTIGYAAPDYLTLALPYAKHAALSFGLLPYSRTNYNVFQLNDASGGLPKSINSFIGDGATYEVYLATGFKIKNLSIGSKGAYLFGTLSNNSRLIFDDTLNGFNTRYQYERKISGFTWTLGLQYELKLKKENSFVFGLSGNTNTKVNAVRSFIYERYVGSSSPYDTISQVLDQSGKIILPTNFNVGVMFKHSDKLSVGINYYANQYANYRSFDDIDSTSNSYKLSIGIEYKPSSSSIDGYTKRIKYRAGLYYGDYYISLKNKILNQQGITLGFGLPLNKESKFKKVSYLDLAFDFGTFGTVDQDLIQESFLRFSLGLNFNDIWFIKRKYD